MTTETKPAPLKVTWTRPAEIVEAVTWNTLLLKIDLGFHTWRRVAASLTEGWFSSPSEAFDFVQQWVESHREFTVRTRKLADDQRSLVASYLVQVQGRQADSLQRDDLLYDLTLAMRPNSRNPPAKPDTLAVDWTFNADMTRLVDGDTQELTVDAGFHTDRAVTLRLLGVNCPETKGPSREAGLAASKFSRQWYESHDDLVIQTRKDVRRSTDAFRRYLVTVEGRNTMTNAREDLAQALLGAHQAVPFMEDKVR
jgi:endonuclease YncB( thermonuclease family)